MTLECNLSNTAPQSVPTKLITIKELGMNINIRYSLSMFCIQNRIKVALHLKTYRFVLHKQMHLHDIRTCVVNVRENKTCFNTMSETNIISGTQNSLVGLTSKRTWSYVRYDYWKYWWHSRSIPWLNSSVKGLCSEWGRVKLSKYTCVPLTYYFYIY